MANKRKYIYGEQFAQKLPGSNQNYYFRTVTTYEVDNNGNPIQGTAGTNLYYAPKPAARTSGGKTWTAGTADSIDNFDQGGWVVAGLTADGGKTYTFERYTQEDADFGRIPSGKNVGDVVLGATAQQSLSTSGGRFYEAVQNNLINLAANTQSGLAKVVSAKQANAAGGGGSGGNPLPAATPPSTDITDAGKLAALTGVDINLSIASAEYRTEYAKGFDKNQYYYPVDLASNKQDRIKFTMKTNEGSTINTKFGQTDPFKRKAGTAIKGEVYLPIQPSITDSNSVDWSGGSLNPVAAAAAGASLQLIKSDSAFQLGQKAGEIAGAVMAALRTPNAQNAMNVYFAQEAVGIQGLLSRTTGAVLNPNLELLFGGPTLRPFSFTFRLSPRDEKEANSVREIIRFFKQGMAVKKASTSAFLKSPNIFDIKYLTYLQDGTLSDHPAINRIKTCALIGCDVDYTPDGTYMTFNDSSRTMTSYQLSLRFSELDPIYESDYGDDTPIPNSHIGY